VLGVPAHPYTAALIAASPKGVPGRFHALEGSVPPLGSQGPGCAFAPRCVRAAPDCQARPPGTAPLDAGHTVACHHPERVVNG
jgi:oligopeptide/dipeptide ABC transporter ATP-binding protein